MITCYANHGFWQFAVPKIRLTPRGCHLRGRGRTRSAMRAKYGEPYEYAARRQEAAGVPPLTA